MTKKEIQQRYNKEFRDFIIITTSVKKSRRDFKIIECDKYALKLLLQDGYFQN